MNDATDRVAGAGADPPAGRKAGWCTGLWPRALERLLRLSPDETRVATRGFEVESPRVVERLEDIGASFVHGYNSALRSASLDALMGVLAPLPPADAGFAFEGAAMGLALADWMTPGRRRFEAFVAGPALAHEYMAWVGLGWSFARLPVSPVRALRRYRSINKWLALDGYGFHEGYFGWRQSVSRQRRPRSLAGSAARVFDQGLGRSLWFVCGASAAAVARTVEAFAQDRRGDLWSGIGLAATYAGGVDRAGLGALREAAAGHVPALGQGVVFAAQARLRAGNPVPHAVLACREILGLDLPDAAALATRHLPSEGDDIESFQRWRFAIQAGCARSGLSPTDATESAAGYSAGRGGDRVAGLPGRPAPL